MQTCKNCLCCEVCDIRKTLGDLEEARFCPQFKDRSKFIELPCDVGGNVYVINGRGKIKSFKIVCIKTTKSLLHFNPEHIRLTLGCEYPNKGLIWFEGDKMKNVYFSYEQAEQALKERENYADL